MAAIEALPCGAKHAAKDALPSKTSAEVRIMGALINTILACMYAERSGSVKEA